MTSSPLESLPPTKPARLVSLDAYRGFIMLVMASEQLGFPKVVQLMKKQGMEVSGFWNSLAYQFDHVPWTGCAFWDLIQPSFMFMVGVAIPYSHASRKAKGDSNLKIAWHVFYRSLLLIFLGIFLISNGKPETNFSFVNVLTQIGLGYGCVYLFHGRGAFVQLAALAVILGGYWYWFFQFPAPGADFDYASAGVGGKVPIFTGLFAHWNMNTNAAAEFDSWFLNLFPQAKEFRFNTGGYQTLNFIPSMATMLFGLMAGELLRGWRTPNAKCARLFGAGLACLLIGAALNYTVCPSVKRIWTPSWAVYSTGWTFLMLAAFYWIIDLRGYQLWAFPFVVVGMNSIAMYCMALLLPGWIRSTFKTHLGQHIFEGTYFLPDWIRNTFKIHFGERGSEGMYLGHEFFNNVYAPIVEKTLVLVILWLICLWMYRRKIFLRI